MGVPTLDFVHAAPGRLWVQQKVADALAQSGLTGLTFHKVHLKPERKRVREETLPPLYELGIASRLRRKAFTPEEQVVCTICGRREFRDPGWLAVDESSWEGSDFMRLADNENYVVVTERAAEFVMQFDNVALHPMKDPDWA